MSLSYCLLQNGCNAFHVCTEGGHVDIAEYLVPKMKDHLFDTDDHGYTAIHWAAQEGHLPMIDYLVKTCHLDVESKTKVGLHCLLYV